MNYGIVVAAGKSERMGRSVDKVFLSLGTQPVLSYSLAAFEHCADIDAVILVVRKDRVDAARGMSQMYGYSKVKRVIAGGAKRQASVTLGLAEVSDDARIVAVHDGGRPCVTPELISETIKTAKRYGSGVAAVKLTDTVKEVEKGVTTTGTLDRSKIWAVQTPQTFKIDLLRSALDLVKKKKATVTDESSAVELLGEAVRLVPAPMTNIKITTPDDLTLAAALLKL